MRRQNVTGTQVYLVHLVLAAFSFTQAHADLVDCMIVEDRWGETDSSTTLAEQIEIYELAHYDSNCDGGVVERIGLEIIGMELERIQEVYEMVDDDDSLRSLLDRLNALQEYGSHWQLSFLSGELSRKLRDVAGAVESYQYALALVDDEELTPVAPTREQILLLRDRLDEVSVVAAQVLDSGVVLPKTRSGELISQYSFATRGIKRKKALVPIQFVFAKDVMTEAGRASFQDVLKTLNAQGNPDITVIGHTDPDGPTDYNMRLSIDRANAVRSELIAQNYPGAIRIVGKGEDEPLRFPDPGLYSLDVRNQANRRVEFVLKDD